MNTERLHRQFGEMEAFIARGEEFLQRRVEMVSGWAVSQHLDHLLKVCRRVLLLLLRSETISPKGLNPLGHFVMLTGFIPRGKGKAPEAVLGEPKSGEELKEALRECVKLFDKLLAAEEKLPAKSLVFPHPFFGGLTKQQSIRFLGIHNHHHFKIIRDISRISASSEHNL